MKRIILLSCIYTITAMVNAQATKFEWAKRMAGGTYVDYGSAIDIDNLGNVYTTGTFGGTVDFDPGSGVSNLSTTGNEAMFVSKLDSFGNFIWAKKIASTLYAQGKAIDIDASGNICITGQFQGTTDFNPGSGTFNLSTSSSHYDVFILKLDSSGNFIWAKQMAGNNQSYGNSIEVDASGNIYTTGRFNGICDFDPGAGTFKLNTAGTNIFVSKLSASGNFIWAKSIGKNYNRYSYNSGNSIALDQSGHVYIGGTFQGNVDFDPGSGTSYMASFDSTYDIFIAKLDTTGNFGWSKQMGGDQIDEGRSIVLDKSGNVYITGYFQIMADFDPGTGKFEISTSGYWDYDIFVSKLNSSGNFVWAKNMGGTGFDAGSSITIDRFNNIYTTGIFQGTADFSPGSSYNLTSAGQTDIFIAKLDASGSLRWAKNMGGTSSENANAIKVNASDNIYTTGWYRIKTDFDPGSGTFYLTTTDSSDIFIHKMSQALCKTGKSTLNKTACTNYTSPSGKYIWTSSNIYNDTIHTKIGCDSIITINLTIKDSSSSLQNQIACFNYILNGQTYTTSGVYYQTLINKAGCDSILKLNLKISQPTKSSLVQTACTSYELNGKTYTMSGVYTQKLTNTEGCDSILKLNLTIIPPTTNSFIQTACGSYNLNGQIFSSSGVYTQTLTNSIGCDSVITFYLTIKKTSTSVLNQVACNIYKLNGQTYTSSGVYTQILTNSIGCDSVITLNLTIDSSTAFSLNKTTCRSYKLNGKTYTTSGIYTQKLTNTAGCDSIIILYLTIDMVNSTVILKGDTLTAKDSGATYQWLDCNNGNKPIAGETKQTYIARSIGNYAVIVTRGTCSDTSVCLTVSTLELSKQAVIQNVFSIYPNPTNGLFNVLLSNPQDNITIEIFNRLGALIYKQTYVQELNIIDLNQQVNGLYIVKVMEEGHQPTTQKIIKQ